MGSHLSWLLSLDTQGYFKLIHLLPHRGVVLFRPPRLANKFEDSSIKYPDDKITSAKIKKFIQENM